MSAKSHKRTLVTATKKHLASVPENPMHAVPPFAAMLVIIDDGRVNQRTELVLFDPRRAMRNS
jgi:hypothetical protein